MENYKEKLEAARKLYDKVRFLSSAEALETCLTLEKIFPELTENEDEKIRKALIQGLSELRTCFPTCPTFGGVKVEDILAWLEKQKHVVWSKKDELKLTDALLLIQNADDCAGIIPKEETIDWLKSLKPTNWKPSIE